MCGFWKFWDFNDKLSRLYADGGKVSRCRGVGQHCRI
jgi:hypothetical protein